MEELEILNRLNKLLLDADTGWEQVQEIIWKLTNDFGIKAKIIDFEFYSEERLEHAESEKYKAIRKQYYEEAAIWRDKISKIRQHIDLRKDLQLSSSAFKIEHNRLFFFHTGKGPFDQKVLEWLRG